MQAVGVLVLVPVAVAMPMLLHVLPSREMQDAKKHGRPTAATKRTG